MKLFRDRSIKVKLIALSAVSVCVALTMACVGFLASDIRLMRDAQFRQARTLSQLLAYNGSAALLLKDNKACEQLLASLSEQPTIEFAAFYDEAGIETARFVRHLDEGFTPSCPNWPGHRYAPDGGLELAESVRVDGQTIGQLYLRFNSENLRDQLWQHMGTAIVVLLCAFVAAVVMSLSMQRKIAAPILELAETAERITLQNDYSIRVTPPSNDEIGKLFSAFNKMLSQVEISEAALMAIHGELENRVAKRTEQLTQEIATREQVQQALVLAKDAAESANRAKSEFLANMSHEIRTPLNAILGFAGILRRDDETLDTAARREYLDTIHQSGDHLVTLINDILDLSKIEAGQLTVEQIACSPHQTIAEVISILRIRAQEKGLTLDYRWSGPVPERIVSDPARLRQLLFNIAGNALKFTDHGGVSLVARIQDWNHQPRLVVDVVDTGIGIPEDKLETIFDPFSQADNSVTRRFGGTGLGLAICRRIALALGGEVLVRSQLGKGSTFSISVATGPLTGVKPLEIANTDPAPQREASAEKKKISLAGTRILVADDGDTNRKLLQIVLKRAGAEVVTAENGKVAMDIALSENIDVILMDMQMPVMDGYTATSRLRERCYSKPILALTAHALTGDADKCLNAGCSGYLTKPIDQDKILTTLHQVISGSTPDKTNEKPAPKTPTVERIESPLISTLPLDDPEFCEIVEEFIMRLRDKHQQMQVAFQEQNWNELKQLAHWLKGAGGTAGFDDLTNSAREVETTVIRGDLQAIQTSLTSLGQLIKRVTMPNAT